MALRYVRDSILASKRVNKLDWAAEVFYRRLMSVVDDFGRFEADPPVLRAALYPRKLDEVSDEKVGTWMMQCVNAGLIRLYKVNGSDYLEFLDLRQGRAKVSKYPAPPRK